MAGYAGRLVTWAKDKTHIVLEIVRRNATAKGFEVLPRRWVVERTFAWIMKNRRFARDYEQLTSVAETLIVIAACATLVRRWPVSETSLLKHAHRAAGTRETSGGSENHRVGAASRACGDSPSWRRIRRGSGHGPVASSPDIGRPSPPKARPAFPCSPASSPQSRPTPAREHFR